MSAPRRKIPLQKSGLVPPVLAIAPGDPRRLRGQECRHRFQLNQIVITVSPSPRQGLGKTVITFLKKTKLVAASLALLQNGSNARPFRFLGNQTGSNSMPFRTLGDKTPFALEPCPPPGLEAPIRPQNSPWWGLRGDGGFSCVSHFSMYIGRLYLGQPLFKSRYVNAGMHTSESQPFFSFSSSLLSSLGLSGTPVYAR